MPEDSQIRPKFIEWPRLQSRRLQEEDAETAQGKRDKLALTISLVAAVCILLGSITSGTLWIDEGFSAWIASHTGFAGLIHTLRTGDSSGRQMPLYYIYLWSWAHFWGHSEYTLRAANLPFGVLLCLALEFTSWKVWGRTIAWTALCFSPFVGTYMTESRAYLPLMACAAASTSALLIYAFAPLAATGKQQDIRLPWLCLGFFFLAAAMDMLAIFVVPGLIVLAIVGVRKQEGRSWWRDWRRPVFVFGPIFAVLGGYYLWTVLTGHDYDYVPFSAGQLGFIVYELLGFAGLGPGRNFLRLHHDTQALLPYWPWLLAGLVGFVSVIAAALAGRLPDRRSLKAIIAALLISLLFVAACGVLLHNRFLPRHTAALHPLLLFALLALWGRRSTKGRPGREFWTVAAVTGLAATWVLSDARLRKLPEYQKEDYRQAAAVTLTEGSRLNADIAWCADNFTGSYYGLNLSDYGITDDKSSGGHSVWPTSRQVRSRVAWPALRPAYIAVNWDPSKAQEFVRQRHQRGTPVVFAISKPDLYDQKNAWTSLIASNGIKPERQLNGFEIYLLR